MKFLFLNIFSVLILLSGCNLSTTKINNGSWVVLNNEVETIGKDEWRPMLKYVAELHRKSTHKAVWPFDYEWEEIGPGYVYGPAFGHWDIVHQAIDVMHAYPEHSLRQLLNDVKNQEPNGIIPGSIYMPKKGERDKAVWSKNEQGHPPVWVFAVNDYIDLTGQDSVLKYFYSPLIRQITWFENNRKAVTEGFYYNDILLKLWESGVDEGVRFDDVPNGKFACIDATSLVYYLYKEAAKWAEMVNQDSRYFKKREKELGTFIQDSLCRKDDGLFYDYWAIKDSTYRTLAFETFFPLIVKVATPEQANRLIDTYLLDTTCFNTAHPIPSVGKRDPKFELRMWRGGAWNSMTYWVARACVQYEREDAARIILEKALDESAKQFDRTGTIWEFYHPLGGKPEDVKRKNYKKSEPCIDYLGHNPLIEMARLFDKVK